MKMSILPNLINKLNVIFPPTPPPQKKTLKNFNLDDSKLIWKNEQKYQENNNNKISMRGDNPYSILKHAINLQ